MNDITSMYSSIVQVWRELPLGPYEKSFIRALVFGISVFAVVCAIERAYGKQNAYSRRRGFWHDVGYWVYYRTGLDTFFYGAVFFAALEKPLSFLDLALLKPLPSGLQAVILLIVIDFMGYWAHRAQHHFRFLWAFHTTHHSQEHMTLFTGARFHPLDTLWLVTVSFIAARIFGSGPQVYLAVVITLWLINLLIHTRIPWGYGPLFKVLVSPNFHAYHHSADPAHYDKNFSSGTFSFWDYLFGTAVPDGSPVPGRLGLKNVKATSLWSTLITPFYLLYTFYITPARDK